MVVHMDMIRAASDPDPDMIVVHALDVNETILTYDLVKPESVRYYTFDRHQTSLVSRDDSVRRTSRTLLRRDSTLWGVSTCNTALGP